MVQPTHQHGGAKFAWNGICEERGWKLQGKENLRKGPKIRNHVNLQRMDFAKNIAYRRTMLRLSQFRWGQYLACYTCIYHVRVIVSCFKHFG